MINPEKIAYQKGYRVNNEYVISPKGNILSIFTSESQYPSFVISIGSRANNTRKIITVKVHRLVAYQKFGDYLYTPGIVCRHKDNNKLNFKADNILVGTQSENHLDNPKEERIKKAVKAATKLRRFTDFEMDEIRAYKNAGHTYKEIMEKYDISSKGTVSYIINTKYKTCKNS